MENEEVGELGIEADKAEPRDRAKAVVLAATCGFARVDIGRLVIPARRKLGNRIAKASSDDMANEGMEGRGMQ